MPQNGEELLDIDTDVSGETDVEIESGEAPDTTGSEPATGDPSDSADPGSSPPRDKAGRFTTQSSRADAKRDLLSTDADTGDEPPAPETDRAAAGTTDGPAASPTGEAPVAPEGGDATAPKIEHVPWAVTESGEEHLIDGAVYVKGHGVLIPEAKKADLERLVSRGIRYNKTWRQLREQQEAVKAQAETPSAEVLEAKALLTELRPLLDPNNVEALAEFLGNPTQNLEALLARVDQQLLKAENARLKQAAEAGQQGVQQVERQEQLASTFQSAFERIANHAQFRGKLPPEQVQAAFQKLFRYHPRFFRNAEADMPEYGVTKGELIIEQQVIIDELQDRMEIITRAEEEKQKIRAEAERVAALAKKNERAVASAAGGKTTIPVARSSAGVATRPKVDSRQTARDAKRDLMDTEPD
jgi:hypothetical protein